MILSHRISLDPTVKQQIFFAKACGCARFAWNWALNEWNKQYKAGLKPNGNKLNKQFNKEVKPNNLWLYESPANASQQPFLNLQKAFNQFFKKKSELPKFKKKGEHDSFYITNTKFKIIDNKHIKLPLIGSVRINEPLRFDGKIMSATVSREADKWFISIAVNIDKLKKPRIANNQIGIDLGINHAITCSNGQFFNSLKPLKQNIIKLRRLSKSHSRKQKGSKNKKKSQLKLAKLYIRIKNIRKDWTHKMTTKLVRENQTICLEDLNVKGMITNYRLARSISDIGFKEIRRQLEYKSSVYDSKIIVIDRWLPSSKTCSNCGCKKELSLSERVFKCNECGFELDRDLNAAINIKTAGLAGLACGPESSGFRDGSETKLCRDEAGTRTLKLEIAKAS